MKLLGRSLGRRACIRHRESEAAPRYVLQIGDQRYEIVHTTTLLQYCYKCLRPAYRSLHYLVYREI